MTPVVSLNLTTPPPPHLTPHSLSTDSTTFKTVPNTDTGLQFRRKLLYLESLNINTVKALTKNPHFRSSPLETLLSVEHTLTSPPFNLPRAAVGRILDMFPQLLTATPTSLLSISSFLLHDVALPPSLLPAALTRCPRILVSDLHHQLRPAHRFLHHHLRLSFHYTTRAVSPSLHPSSPLVHHKINTNTIVLLVSSVDHTLAPKLEFLKSLRFDDSEVLKLVRRSPPLLTYSIENNLTPKSRYFIDEMKGDLAEIKRFPQYFSFSLEGKIKPRHRLLMEHGFRMSLRDVLKVSDGEFNVRLLDLRLRRGGQLFVS